MNSKKLLLIISSFYLTGIIVEKALCHGPDILATVGVLTGGVELRAYSHLQGTLTVIPGANTNTAFDQTSLNGIAWSPDGNFLATRSGDDIASDSELEVYSFNGTSFTLFSSVDLNSSLGWTDDGSASWSSDCKHIAITDFGSGKIAVFLSNPITMSLSLVDEVTSIELGTFIAIDAQWSPDGKYLAAVGSNIPANNELIMYSFNGTSLTVTDSFEHKNFLQTVRWAPNGKHFAVVGTPSVAGSNPDTRIFSFNATTGTMNLTDSQKHGGTPVGGLAWSPDGSHVATGGIDDFVRVWQFSKSAETITLKDSFDHGDNVHGLDWSPDGCTLAMVGEPSGGFDTRTLHFNRNTEMLTLEDSASHGASVLSVAWQPVKTCFFGDVGIAPWKKLLVDTICAVTLQVDEYCCDCVEDPYGTVCVCSDLGLFSEKQLLINHICPVTLDECDQCIEDTYGTTCITGNVGIKNTLLVNEINPVVFDIYGNCIMDDNLTITFSGLVCFAKGFKGGGTLTIPECFDGLKIMPNAKLLVNKIAPVNTDGVDCLEDPIGTICLSGDMGINLDKKLLVKEIQASKFNEYDCCEADLTGTICVNSFIQFKGGFEGAGQVVLPDCFDGLKIKPGQKLLVNQIDPVKLDGPNCVEDVDGTTCFSGKVGLVPHKKVLTNRICAVKLDAYDNCIEDSYGCVSFCNNVLIPQVTTTSLFISKLSVPACKKSIESNPLAVRESEKFLDSINPQKYHAPDATLASDIEIGLGNTQDQDITLLLTHMTNMLQQQEREISALKHALLQEN